MNIPEHIAIIMDGNGRWAKKRNLPRIMGHRAGVKTVDLITEACSERGIKALTLYAFSTENWNRDRKEVNYLMKLLEEKLLEEIDQFDEKGIRFVHLGRKDRVPKRVRDAA